MKKALMKNNMWAWGVIIVSLITLFVMNVRRRIASDLYPKQAITLICPFSPGGGTDLLSRKLAHEAEKELGVPVLVSNITGGGGAIGHAAGRMALADGYSILVTTFELVSLPILGLVPFTYKDFDLLMLLNMDPAAVAVRKDYPANTLEEFIKQAKNGKAPSIGNSGAGAVWHLAAAMFADRAKIKVTHVPFNGASQAITALIGGHIDAVTVSAAELKTYIESGQVKLLGVMSPERLAGFKDIPSCREQGLDLVFGTWRGLTLPKGVPEDRRKKLEDTFRQVVESEAFSTFAAQSGMNLQIVNGKEFYKMVRKQSIEVKEVMQKLEIVK